METCCALSPIYFIALWFGSMLLIARVGWSQLAEKYACHNPYNGPKQGWQWGMLNWAAYKGCLWLAISPDGLYLETGPSLLFRAFHPPLLIPWSAIKSVKETKYWFMRVLEIKFMQSDVKLRLRAKFLPDLKPFLGQKISDNQLIED